VLHDFVGSKCIYKCSVRVVSAALVAPGETTLPERQTIDWPAGFCNTDILNLLLRVAQSKYIESVYNICLSFNGIKVVYGELLIYIC